MADIEQLKRALINADKAGDAEGARKLAAAIKSASAPKAQQVTQPAKPEEPGFLEKVGDIFTGNLREVASTEALPPYEDMPEMNDLLSAAGWKTGAGTLFSSPSESVKVIIANNPGVKMRQDEKGNYILRSAKDGKEYAIHPGFRIGDIPRAGSAIASQLGIGKAVSAVPKLGAMGEAGLAGRAALGATEAAAGQTAIEASQAATGGEFNPEEVAMAAGVGGSVPVAGAALRTAKSAVAPKAKAATPTQPSAAISENVASPKQPAAQLPVVPENAIPVAEGQQQFGELVRKASGRMPGSGAAKKELARLAVANPEAADAAIKLGIELPVDVASDNRLLQEAAGQIRALKGTDASVKWAEEKTALANKMQETLAAMDGSADISLLSAQVKDSIEKTRNTLNASAKELYKQVDDAVPKNTRVPLTNTQQLLSDVLKNNPNSMTQAERKLMELATQPDGLTYGDLTSIKSDIGAALRGQKKGSEDYTSIAQSRLEALNRALGEDKIAAVGEELAPILRQADRFTAQQKAYEKRIINAFGKDGEGSIASQIEAAVKAGKGGDPSKLRRVLKTVPDDLRQEAIMSAIYRQSRTETGGNFSFKKFATTYSGLRENSEVYKEIAKTMTPEQQELLRAMYVVSKRVGAAEDKISKTGASLQPMLGALNAQSLIGKVTGSNIGRLGLMAVGAKVGGPIGAAAAAGAGEAVRRTEKEGMEKAAKLLTSDSFANLVSSVTKDGEKVSGKLIKDAANSRQFYDFAKAMKLPLDPKSRELWIRNAIIAEQNLTED